MVSFLFFFPLPLLGGQVHTLDDLLQAVAKLGDGDAAKLRMVDLQVKFNTFLSSKVLCGCSSFLWLHCWT